MKLENRLKNFENWPVGATTPQTDTICWSGYDLSRLNLDTPLNLRVQMLVCIGVPGTFRNLLTPADSGDVRHAGVCNWKEKARYDKNVRRHACRWSGTRSKLISHDTNPAKNGYCPKRNLQSSTIRRRRLIDRWPTWIQGENGKQTCSLTNKYSNNGRNDVAIWNTLSVLHSQNHTKTRSSAQGPG